ncbi:MAG: hypothetical protein K6G31_02865 [Paludibacteraceae bacterium]|nr:hypothetical protein [Paludibacteraceae bacterium]
MCWKARRKATTSVSSALCDFGSEYGYFMLSELKGAFNMPIIINGKQTTLPVQIERDE